MSVVMVLWSAAAAAGVLIAIIHTTIWLHDRRVLSSLAITVAALSLVGVAVTEMGMMGATSPEEWGRWVRWTHLPMYFLIVSLAVFVGLRLGTGRAWMLWSLIAIRSLILVANFAVQPAFNFADVAALGTIRFLGEDVSVLGKATVGPFQWLATLSVILLIAYVADATLTLWRRKALDGRRKLLFVGVCTLLFVSLSGVFTQLVIWGGVQLPMLITPPFLLLLLALGYELGTDSLRATQLTRNLRQSDHWLELAADAAHLGMWTIDMRRGRILATERSRALLGFRKGEELDLEKLSAHLHVEDRSRVRQVLERSFTEHTAYHVEFRIRAPGQSDARWIASRGVVEYDEESQGQLVRGVLQNITDQKLALIEAERLRSEVSHSGRIHMLGRLVSALAHELCQPLAATLRNVEAAGVMLDRPSTRLEDLRAIIVDIHRDNQRARDIIDRLRSLLKRRQMQFTPLSPESLLSDADLLIRADAAARHVALEYQAQGPLPKISGDRVHLSQVLINLLQNGIDATCDIKDTPRRVTVTARSLDAATVEIAVADTGSGLAPEAQSRLFEPFFTTKPEGMGMGLSVCRTIVEAHGGSLRAENQSQGGAVFRIHLPAMAGAAA